MRAGRPAGGASTGAGERFALGDLDFEVDAGDIRRVRVGGVEALRRAFVTVRDERWVEIAPSGWEFWVSRSDTDVLVVRVRAEHPLDGGSFVWDGEIIARARERSLTFRVAGRIDRPVRVCRVGVVVLHPPVGVIDTGVAPPLQIGDLAHPQELDGSTPLGITPPFRSLRQELPSGHRVQIEFDGGDYEIEDQRNFGDFSFKSYTPPLSSGFPYLLEPGDRIVQGVSFRVEAPIETAPAIPPGWSTARPPELGMAGLAGRVAGHVQVGMGSDGSGPSLRSILATASASADSVHLVLPANRPEDSESAVAAALADSPAVTRVLLRPAGSLLASSAEVEAIRAVLGRAGREDIAVYTLIEDFPVELNRGVPTTSASGLALTVSPNVHSGDGTTIAENVEAARAVILTASALHPGRPVAIGVATFASLAGVHSGVRESLAVPWAAALAIELAGTPAEFVTLGEDIVAAGSEEAWASVLEAVRSARGPDVAAEVSVDAERGCYALRWTRRDRRMLLAATVFPSPAEVEAGSAVADVRLIWPRPGGAREPVPTRPSRGSTTIEVPGLSVVLMDAAAPAPRATCSNGQLS